MTFSWRHGGDSKTQIDLAVNEIIQNSAVEAVLSTALSIEDAPNVPTLRFSRGRVLLP